MRPATKVRQALQNEAGLETCTARARPRKETHEHRQENHAPEVRSAGIRAEETMSGPRARIAGRHAIGGGGSSGPPTGSRTVKVVPMPGGELNEMLPP